MAALSWATINLAMPRFEKKQRSAVVRSVLSSSDTPISMGIKGFTATLSGEVPDEKTHQAIVQSLGIHTGILRVTDRLSVRAEPQTAPNAPLIEPIAGLDDASANVTVPLRATDVEPPEPSNLPDEYYRESEQAATDAQVSDAVSPDATPDNPNVVAQATVESEEIQAPTAPSLATESAELITNSVPPELTGTAKQKTPTPSAETSKSAQSVDATDTTNTAQPTEAAEPEPVTEPVETAQTTDLAELVENTGAAEAEAETTESVKQSTESVESDELEQPTYASAAVENRLPADSITPQENEKPSDTAEFEQAPKSSQTTDLTESNNSTESTKTLVSSEAAESTAKSQSDQTSESESLAEHVSAGSGSQALQQALSKLPSLRILFESNSDVLTQESLEVLNQIADVLLTFPEFTMSIEGHTDSTGSNEENLTLSLLRSMSVRSYLVERGVSVFNLKAKGFGEEIPIADNRTANGRTINRRIEFTF